MEPQRPGNRITPHLVTSTLLAFEGADRARGTSPVLLWTGDEADPDTPQGRRAHGPQLLGQFDDVFVRLPGHGWRILRREARFVLHA